MNNGDAQDAARQQHHHLRVAARPCQLRSFIATHSPSVSAVSYVEVLGFHRLTEEDRTTLTAFFGASRILPIDQPILERAVSLRQQRRLSLGDSLIAATALVHHLQLVTHNTDDFSWITELQLIDPLQTP